MVASGNLGTPLCNTGKNKPTNSCLAPTDELL
jgi:hypothetical protein